MDLYLPDIPTKQFLSSKREVFSSYFEKDVSVKSARGMMWVVFISRFVDLGISGKSEKMARGVVLKIAVYALPV